MAAPFTAAIFGTTAAAAAIAREAAWQLLNARRVAGAGEVIPAGGAHANPAGPREWVTESR